MDSDTPTRQLEGAVFSPSDGSHFITYVACSLVQAVGISELDFAFEGIQSRVRDGYLGDSLNNRPSISMPRRRVRRHGTMLSEKQSIVGWNNNTTDDSGVYSGVLRLLS
jgi:hypothetical protein